MSQESYDEHRARDEKTATGWLVFFYLFPSFRWLISLFIIVILFAWTTNILGTSTVFNSKDIYYSGINPWTAKMETVKGCRPEHLTIDRQCDNTITIGMVKKSFPFFGEAKNKS